MRVLHVHSGNLYGGVESMLVTLARHRHLRPELENRFALCFEARLARELGEAGSPVAHLGKARIRNPVSLLRTRARLRHLLSTEAHQAVLVHSDWSQALYGPTALKAGLPLVRWVHGPSPSSGWLARWARRSRPRLVLSNSRYTASAAGALFPAAPVEVIHPPVPPPAPPPPKARMRLRGSLDTPGNAQVVIQVSRLERWKGQLVLLQALGLLRDHPGWILWMVGGAQRPEEKRYTDELAEQAEDLGITGRVRFLGERGDVPALLAAADLFCQPNTAPEPFGITLVEAMLAGLPVVTSEMGGAKEIVEKTAGLLVPPGEPERLAEAVARLLADEGERRRLGARARERALALCDPGAALARLHRLLADLGRAA